MPNITSSKDQIAWYKPFFYSMYAQKNILSIVSIHLLALLYGLWPLFNLMIWSNFYSSFYGNSVAIFYAVCGFLCLQSIVHTFFDALLQFTTQSLSAQQSTALREQIYHNISKNPSALKNGKDLEQSSTDIEFYFKNLLSMSTNLVTQIGNLFGNFFNLYRAGLFLSTLLFFCFVVIYDLVMFLVYRYGNTSIPNLTQSVLLKQSDLRTSITRALSFKSLLQYTPSKRQWTKRHLTKLNQSLENITSKKNRLSGQMSGVQKLINTLILPSTCALIVYYTPLRLPLSFGVGFPLAVTSIGAFLQLMESYAQIFRNGSFFFKNGGYYDSFDAAKKNINKLFLVCSHPFTIQPIISTPSPNFMTRILIAIRGSLLYYILLAVVQTFLHIAQAQQIPIFLNLYLNAPIYLNSSCLLFSMFIIYYLRKPRNLRYKTFSTDIKHLVYNFWDISIFSMLLPAYLGFSLLAYLPSYASLLHPALFCLSVIPLSLITFKIQDTLYSTTKTPKPRHTESPSSSALKAIQIHALRRKPHGKTASIDFILPDKLHLTFGKSLLIRGASGIGKSSILIESLLSKNTSTNHIESQTTFPPCTKVFSSQAKALEQLHLAGDLYLTGDSERGEKASLTSLEQYMLSFLTQYTPTSPIFCDLLSVWRNHLQEEFFDFLSSRSLPDSVLTSLKSGKIPNPDDIDKATKVYISCAAIYSILRLPSFLPNFGNILVVLDEGLDDLNPHTKGEICARFKYACNTSSSQSLLISVLHTMDNSLAGNQLSRCFDTILDLTRSSDQQDSVRMQLTTPTP